MKPSQNLLFKADTNVRPVAENGILGLVPLTQHIMLTTALLLPTSGIPAPPCGATYNTNMARKSHKSSFSNGVLKTGQKRSSQLIQELNHLHF
jgi:hypothetical protein